MAIAAQTVKEDLKDLSLDALEEQYNRIKMNYIFNSKEEEVEYIFDNVIYASNDVNNDAMRKALQELLEEKTGKSYAFKEKGFDLKVEDFTDYISKKEGNVTLGTTLNKFLRKLLFISKDRKIRFLLFLYQDKKSFSEFVSSLSSITNAKKSFLEYEKIAIAYYNMHSFIA